jgi:succinate-semialdehyde dehydrogenase/glutarate-semialdehyde dehydrogenase
MATNLQTAAHKITSVNPATGEVLRALDAASEQDVQQAVRSARAAQPSWARVPLRERVAILQTFQRLLQEQKSDVARLITSEAGKPVVEALLTEVTVVLDATRFCVENAYAILREQPVPHRNLAMKTKSGRLLREPHGVIGIIAPWNYPFSIPATETHAALVAGNTVVLKPSELTPLCSLRLADLLHKAGVPADAFQVVVGDGAAGAALVNAEIDKLVFTGSVATGKRIAQAAAARLLPVVLELGGKDPMIILDDADLEVASSGAVWGAFLNAGQTCLSVERCYVPRKLYPKFLDLVVQKTKRLRVGNGGNSEIDVGPLIHERQLRIVESQVQDAIACGARVLTGGNRLPELGTNFYAPTVLADVNHQMRVMRQETFGPLLPVMAFDTDDEAVQLANDSEYGLAASVWTKDRSRAEAIAKQIQAGTVMINDAIACFGISEAPHGGVKASGIGRTHGRYGIEEMVRLKYIDSDRLAGVKKVWWYGYGEIFTRQMESFADFMFANRLLTRLRSGIRAVGAIRRKGRL